MQLAIGERWEHLGHVVCELLGVAVERVGLEAIAQEPSLEHEVQELEAEDVDEKRDQVAGQIFVIEPIVGLRIKCNVPGSAVNELPLQAVIAVGIDSQIFDQLLDFGIF